MVIICQHGIDHYRYVVGLAVSLSLQFNYDPFGSESTLPPYMPVKIETKEPHVPCCVTNLLSGL